MKHLSIEAPLETGLRIEELKRLKAGWLDGKGVALSHVGLDWLSIAWETYYPGDLPLPFLFPTPEGDVLAEWSQVPHAITLQIDLSQHSGAWHALNLETAKEETRTLNLNEVVAWSWLTTAIRSRLGEVA